MLKGTFGVMIQVQEMKIEDYEEIFAFWSNTKGMGLSTADSRQNIEKFLLRNKDMSFCCKEEDRIVGTIMCGHDGRRGFIYHLAVSEAYRWKGMGRLLVERCLKRLEEEGIDKCHLFVMAGNEAGNAFWSSVGWKKRNDIITYSRNTT